MPKLNKQKIIAVEVVDKETNPIGADTVTTALKPFYRFYLDAEIEAPDAETLKKITLALKKLNLPSTETPIKVLENFEINNTYNFVIQNIDQITVHSAQPIPFNTDELNNLELKTTIYETHEPFVDTELVKVALQNNVFAAKTDESPITPDLFPIQLNYIAGPIPLDNAINGLYSKVDAAATLIAQQTEEVAALEVLSADVNTVIQRGKKISRSSMPNWPTYSDKNATLVLGVKNKKIILKQLQTRIQTLLSTVQKQYDENITSHPEEFSESRMSLIRAMQLTALTYYRELRFKPAISPQNIMAFNDQFEKVARIAEHSSLIFDANLLSANHTMLENIVNGMLDKFNKYRSLTPWSWGASRPRALFDGFFKSLKIKFCQIVDKTFGWQWGELTAVTSMELLKTESEFGTDNKSIDTLVRDFQVMKRESTALLNTVQKYAAECQAKVDELKRLRESIAGNVQEANTIVAGMETNCQGIDQLIEAVEDRLAFLKEAAKSIDGHFASPANLIVAAKTTLATIKAESDNSLTKGKIPDVQIASDNIKKELEKLTAGKATLAESNKDLLEINKLMAMVDKHIAGQNAAATQDDRIISAAMKIASLFGNDSLAYWQDQVRWKGGVRMDTSFGTFTVPLSIFRLFTEKQKLRMPVQIAEARAFLEVAKEIADDAEQRGSHRLGIFRVRSYEVSKLQLLIADIKLNQANIGFTSKQEFDDRMDKIKPDWRSNYQSAMRGIKPAEVEISRDENSATVDPASLSLSASSVSAVSTPSNKENTIATTINRSLSRSSLVV